MKNNSVDFNKDVLPFQLGLLQKAENYQKWSLEAVNSFLGNRILEIGSGIGNMSRWLPLKERLILSEINPDFFKYLESVLEKYFFNDKKATLLEVGTDSNWKEKLLKENIDTIVSFNVLEHIEKDKDFISDLLFILKNSKSNLPKRLITFVPAHQFAFGSIDLNYGHFRRYSHLDLKKIKEELIPEAKFFCRYFNFTGLIGWTICGRIMNKKDIDKNSILFFEKLCPWIKSFDDFLHLKLKFPLGQSVFSVITL